LRNWYSDEEIVEEVVRVITEMEKLMPGLQGVLSLMGRDDMILVDGFLKVCEKWLRWKGEVM